jgi:hypothetical protein
MIYFDEKKTKGVWLKAQLQVSFVRRNCLKLVVLFLISQVRDNCRKLFTS